MGDDMKVVRPWGTYEVVTGGDGYQVKRLEVYPASRTSLQYHEHRSETWVVVAGHGLAWHTGPYQTLVKETIGVGDSVSVPLGQVHRIENDYVGTSLVLIEVQVGDIVDEEDIVRVADDYGRV